MMFWNGGNWPFWEVALMWIGMIAFWGLLIWALVSFVGGGNRRPGDDRRLPRDSARHVLDERLARGDITPDAYRHLLDVMSSGDGAGPVDAENRR